MTRIFMVSLELSFDLCWGILKRLTVKPLVDPLESTFFSQTGRSFVTKSINGAVFCSADGRSIMIYHSDPF